jgi:hypothetical protein
MFSGGRKSLLIHPAAADRSGSEARVLVSECPHFEHSNVRCSNPFDPAVTSTVIIRI